MIPDFPEFLPLRLSLEKEYNKIVGPLPLYSDISFATLQVWWNLNEKLSVSLLHKNLVINYQLPNDTASSGLSIVGTNKIDESINVIFNYLEDHNKPLVLKHVPEFVVNKIKNLRLLEIREELDYNEYILDSSALAKLNGHEYQLLRKKMKRFNREVGEKSVDIKELNLSIAAVQDQLFKSIAQWENKHPTQNDPTKVEYLALKKTFQHSAELEIKNLALFIDNQLHGILIYHRPLGKEYYILNHLKANYETPYISDYIHHEVAKRAVKDNVTWLNIEMDLGIENLKKHKMTLRPIAFLKKFTIQRKN